MHLSWHITYSLSDSKWFHLVKIVYDVYKVYSYNLINPINYGEQTDSCSSVHHLSR